MEVPRGTRRALERQDRPRAALGRLHQVAIVLGRGLTPAIIISCRSSPLKGRFWAVHSWALRPCVARTSTGAEIAIRWFWVARGKLGSQTEALKL